jgi:predicted RNase H-like HicB family nuclease
VYVATCPSLPGCISQGKTEREALRNMREAVRLHLRALTADNLPLFDRGLVKETRIEISV